MVRNPLTFIRENKLFYSLLTVAIILASALPELTILDALDLVVMASLIFLLSPLWLKLILGIVIFLSYYTPLLMMSGLGILALPYLLGINIGYFSVLAILERFHKTKIGLFVLLLVLGNLIYTHADAFYTAYIRNYSNEVIQEVRQNQYSNKYLKSAQCKRLDYMEQVRCFKSLAISENNPEICAQFDEKMNAVRGETDQIDCYLQFGKNVQEKQAICARYATDRNKDHCSRMSATDVTVNILDCLYDKQILSEEQLKLCEKLLQELKE